MKFGEACIAITWILSGILQTGFALFRIVDWRWDIERPSTPLSIMFFVGDLIASVYLMHQLLKLGPLTVIPAKMVIFVWNLFFLCLWLAHSPWGNQVSTEGAIVGYLLIWIKLDLLGLTCLECYVPKLLKKTAEAREAARNENVVAVFCAHGTSQETSESPTVQISFV